MRLEVGVDDVPPAPKEAGGQIEHYAEADEVAEAGVVSEAQLRVLIILLHGLYHSSGSALLGTNVSQPHWPLSLHNSQRRWRVLQAFKVPLNLALSVHQLSQGPLLLEEVSLGLRLVHGLI